ncbi:hypothetical protein [Desulfosoma caldarium]|uniref:hypothetical protein n=1 Tax=Desulfosoma caldarium TaxID=610254 RepID=UPI0011CD6BF9|nr:hypothetical protein [Desulfosoma caldarium]
MLVFFFLSESFNHDVCAPVVEPVCYATTRRRRMMDIAAEIVRHSRRVVRKVTAATFEALHFERLWQKKARRPDIAGGERRAAPKRRPAPTQEEWCFQNGLNLTIH